jgi:hypothetical protein
LPATGGACAAVRLGTEALHYFNFQPKAPVSDAVNREREIFNAALEHTAPAERAAYLDEACGDDAVLRESIESLLRIYDLEGEVPIEGNGASQDAAEGEAMGLVAHLVPTTSDAEIVDGLMAALAEARKVGVTSVQDKDGSGAAIRTRLLRLLQGSNRKRRCTTGWPATVRALIHSRTRTPATSYSRHTPLCVSRTAWKRPRSGSSGPRPTSCRFGPASRGSVSDTSAPVCQPG